MPKLEFSQREIKSYWDTSYTVPAYTEDRYNLDPFKLQNIQLDALHPYYMDAINKAEDMKVHADGFFPYKLLKERRPNEPLDVLAYREKIWVAKTKPVFTKIFNSLQKIRRSADWMIKYPQNENEFSRIREGETLQDYCEMNLPFFTSMTNWIFSFALRKCLIDPNAVVMVAPLSLEIPENEILQPFPEIFDSINVLDHKENDYSVLVNPYGATWYDAKGVAQSGKVMFIVTTESTFKYTQINARKNYEATEYPHGLGILPAFKMGGELIDQLNGYFLFESRIAGIIPELDEAIREYSDLQAAKVLHIYPERWEFTNNECTQCKGTGHVHNPSWTEGCGFDPDLTCNSCEGRGYTVAGPYSKMVIKPSGSLDTTTSIPTPPAGFIEKDVEIIKLAEDSVKQHMADALSSINFEFLINVPLSQSGISKQYDRNESNNTSHAVAEDIVALMDKIYKTIAYYRYQSIYPDKQILDDMLPTIPVPENYDLYSISDAQDELNKAKTGNTNPVIVSAMEKDYANKRFSSEPTVKDRLNLILELDPLPNITEDEKMSRLSNKGITQITYIISSNIQEFVQRALYEDESFPDKKLTEKKAVMETYAKEILAATASARIIPMGPTETQIPAQPPIQIPING